MYLFYLICFLDSVQATSLHIEATIFLDFIFF